MPLAAALKIAAPLVVVAALAVHSFGSAFAAEPIGLTNQSGGIGACSAPTQNSSCATLFQGSAVMWPGKAPEQAHVTIGYHGGSASGIFGVYLPRFESKSARSSSLCTAPDPASKLNLIIVQGQTTIYDGTLAAFAAAHHDPSTVLHLSGGHNGSGAADRWAGGDASDFTLSVGLDISADNPYMGCVSTADIAWFAA